MEIWNDDEKELTRHVSDLKMKLIEPGMEINEKSSKLNNLEKNGETKEENIKTIELKVTR